MPTDMPKLRVGHMPYLNSEVFYRTLPPDACDLVTMVPRAMAAAVETGDLDAGPLPVAEVIRLGDALRPLGDLCVASRNTALSVLLFSSKPVEDLERSRVAVTSHTATSIQLLRVLFADRWKLSDVNFVELDEPHDAQLIIGDDALQLRLQGSGYPYSYDLGEQWRLLTGLPFVFALWVVRRDANAALAEALEQALCSSLVNGLKRIDEIAAARTTHYLDEEKAASYVQNFTYTLGDEERRGMAEFARRLGKLPAWRPSLPASMTMGA